MSIEAEQKRWEQESLNPLLQRSPERKAAFDTSSGIPLPRLLTPGDPDPDYLEKLGFPGEYPFTRGVQSVYHNTWAHF